MTMEKTRQAAEQWVAEGRPCFYCHGWRWRGKVPCRITKEEAQEYLKNKDWSFGIGYHELSWARFEDEEVLYFNELSEHDLW